MIVSRLVFAVRSAVAVPLLFAVAALPASDRTGVARAADMAADMAAEPGADAVAEPAGYRLEDYDAPVPAGLTGAITVAGPEVHRLQREAQAIVVDVIPQHRRPPDLASDQFWLPVPHRGVAGALWLPDTGFGALAPVTEHYLFEHLRAASNGRRDRPIVFYCRIDCWMSWNAAKRALAAGYERIYWYRDGIEDWLFEGLPTALLEPAPGPRLPGD